MACGLLKAAVLLLVSWAPQSAAQVACSSSVDLARGRLPTGSSAGQYASYSNATDGDKNTSWQSSDGDASPFLALDLGRNFTISSLAFDTRAVANSPFQQVTFQRSDDGLTWSTVRTDSGTDLSSCESGRRSVHLGWDSPTRYVKAIFGSLCGRNAMIATWQVFGCDPMASFVTTGSSLYCDSDYDILSAGMCQQAAVATGFEWKGAYTGNGEHKYCFYGNGGVWYNLGAGNSTPQSAKGYNSLCYEPISVDEPMNLECTASLGTTGYLSAPLYAPYAGMYLANYAAGDSATRSLVDAQVRCNELGTNCGGITCVDSAGATCTVRLGTTPTASSTGEFSYLKVPNAAVSMAKSVEVWLKVDGNAQSVPLLGNSYYTDKRWGLFLTQTGLFSAINGTSNFSYGSGAPNPLDGGWHHIALASNSLYVDGILSISGIAIQLGRRNDVWFGNYPGRYLVDSSPSSIWMRDIRLWSTNLTQQDVLASMNMTNSGSQNLVSRLLFDGAAIDSSPAGVKWSDTSVDYTCVSSHYIRAPATSSTSTTSTTITTVTRTITLTTTVTMTISSTTSSTSLTPWVTSTSTTSSSTRTETDTSSTTTTSTSSSTRSSTTTSTSSRSSTTTSSTSSSTRSTTTSTTSTTRTTSTSSSSTSSSSTTVSSTTTSTISTSSTTATTITTTTTSSSSSTLTSTESSTTTTTLTSTTTSTSSSSSTSTSTSTTSSSTSKSTTTTTSSSTSSSSSSTTSRTSTTSSTTTRTTTTTSTSSSSSTTSSSSTSSSSSTTTISTTTTVTITFTVDLTSSKTCADDTNFKDERGLSCQDWVGVNCAAGDGYTQQGLLAVQTACPLACGSCQAPPSLIVQTLKKVQAAMNLNGVDLGNQSDQETSNSMKTGVAAALGLPMGNIVNITIEAAPAGSQRRLQGAPAYSIRYEVVVPPSQSLRDVISQATSLAVGGSNALNTFTDSLSQVPGVDLSDLSVEIAEKPAATSVQCVVAADGSLLAAATPSASAGGGASGAVTSVDCNDDIGFLDEQGEGCTGWVGYSCRNTKWMRSERPYTLKGLKKVIERCPLTCGTCVPPNRKSPEELLGNCTDDSYFASFCLRWRGLNCSQASLMGYDDAYIKVLTERCPQSCALCPTTFACEDAPVFSDEKGQPCSSWVGYDCTKQWQGYTRKGIMDVQAACRASCGFCAAPKVGTYNNRPSSRDTNATNASSNGTNASANGTNSSGKVTNTSSNVTIGAPNSTTTSGKKTRRLLGGGATCEDDPDYTYLQRFTCEDFIGRTCSYATLYLEPRWLMGPRAVWNWHQDLWTKCPTSCGLCDPPDRISPPALLTECEDDMYTADWCSYHWKGENCSRWQNSVNLVVPGEAPRYNRTLFNDCAYTCRLCTKPTCGDGTFRDRVAHSCPTCSPGHYAAGERSGSDALSCEAARPGFHISEAGASKEEPCEVGTYSAQPGQTNCTLCEPGRYNDFRGSSDCWLCDPGWFQMSSGTTECTRCPQGEYQPQNGSSACEACPETFTTDLQASMIIDACVCPEGTYRGNATFNSTAGYACLPCPPGITCPGGFSYTNTSDDRTPVLQAGMMSLPEDPFSVYLCAGETDQCPDESPVPYTEDDLANVCPTGQYGARCYKCPDNYYHDSSESCSSCGDTIMEKATGPLIFFAAQFALVWIAYWQQASCQENTPAKQMFWALVAYMQVVQAFFALQVDWPEMMFKYLGFMEYFGYLGFLDSLSFNQECFFGDSLLYSVLTTVVLPILPILDFLMLGVPLYYLGRPLYMPAVVSTIAAVWAGVFINLCVISLQMFPTDAMPNGKRFLKAMPGVEVPSEDWMQSVPVSIAATCVYCVGFWAYSFWGAYHGPTRCEDEDFVEQFDYMFADLHPQAFWWILADTAVVFALAVIQAMFDNIYLMLYFTMLVVMLWTMLESRARPNLSEEVNRTNIALKISMLIFLMFASTLVNTITYDRTEDRKVFAPMIIWTFLAFVFYCSCFFMSAVWQYFCVSPRRAGAEQAIKFRLVAKKIVKLSEERFIDCFENMWDYERLLWKSNDRMLVAAFFGKQFSKNFFEQRVHRHVHPEVFTYKQAFRLAQVALGQGGLAEAMREQALTQCVFTRLMQGMEQNANKENPIVSQALRRSTAEETHKNVQILTGILPSPSSDGKAKSVGFEGRVSAIERQATGHLNVMQQVVKKAKEATMNKRPTVVDEDGFVEQLRGVGGLSDNELRQVFQELDFNEEGKLKTSNLVSLLQLMYRYSGKHTAEEQDLLRALEEGGEEQSEPEEDGPFEHRYVVHAHEHEGASEKGSAQAAESEGEEPRKPRYFLRPYKEEKPEPKVKHSKVVQMPKGEAKDEHSRYRESRATTTTSMAPKARATVRSRTAPSQVRGTVRSQTAKSQAENAREIAKYYEARKRAATLTQAPKSAAEVFHELPFFLPGSLSSPPPLPPSEDGVQSPEEEIEIHAAHSFQLPPPPSPPRIGNWTSPMGL